MKDLQRKRLFGCFASTQHNFPKQRLSSFSLSTYPKAGLALGANAEAVATQAAKQRAVFIFLTRVVSDMHGNNV
jgi:hypothetical protein